MQSIQTEVLVIGGGATGAGVVRDLAMRGFKTILVEKGDLTHGTTGRYHGLLHSGGRYVVKDPQAAKECIEENRILRRIMPFCIEDTGGFFVVTPWDNPAYAPRFLAGCQAAGVPVEEIPVERMLRQEPLLHPNISRCFQVPDASADSFLGTDATAASARRYGAQILTYHQALEVLRQGDRVTGARCLDRVKGEEVAISADMVVNASGAWAGQIAATIGIPVHIIPGKGTMLAINHRILNTVVNRCKLPSDGDILVPSHTVVIAGTTDVPVDDPDRYAIEPWEVDLLLAEGDKMVPGLSEMRILRAWAGVRPLYKETQVSDTREVSRAYVLLDHETRDGVSGFITITSGKWTTYRKMAEVTVDLVCTKLGVERPCRTHLEELPAPHPVGRTGSPANKSGYHSLGARLAEVEAEQAYGDLICECELATRQEVAGAILQGQAKTIDDVRRDVRLGMGPCQGGFCTYRVAGMLHELSLPDVEQTNVALRDFLQERWKGLLPILWGQQLRQERLDELIYLSLLNVDHLPGPTTSPLTPEMYAPPQGELQPKSRTGQAFHPETPWGERPASGGPLPDVLIVGASLAGLAAAWQTTAHGIRARLISEGWGSLYWNAGCIDVLGYHPLDREAPVESPAAALEDLIRSQPAHPYALAGLGGLGEALQAFQDLCARAGYPLQGSLERNWFLPSAAGAIRPTCLAPETMIAGDLRRQDPMLIVGFAGFPDFYPGLIAANLSAQGIPAQGLVLDLPILRQRRFITGRVLAGLFDQPDFRSEVAGALKTQLPKAVARLGFPAVLGLDHPLAAVQDLSEQLGPAVFEIPTLPPSIPGIRLATLLIAAIEKAGGRVFDGMQAVAVRAQDGLIESVQTEAAARLKSNRARAFVLATGGILGGGIEADYRAGLREVVAGLPVNAPARRQDWFQPQFLAPSGHPVYRAGLSVNGDFQPVSASGQVIFQNLYAAGTALANGEFLRERSLEGVALASGYRVGNLVYHAT